MSGLGIDFGHDSEAYSTDTSSRRTAASTSTSGFHSRTRAHMIPKKSSMNKMRGLRPRTAEEDARRVRIVSGEPDVLGYGAYTDEDFMSPPLTTSKVISQPHQLHSLSAAVAAMGGYTTDTATSSTEIDSDQSPTLTESSVTSRSSASSSSVAHKQNEATAASSRPLSTQHLRAENRTVRNSRSNTSLASGYRSDGGSSLGRSAEISRGAGRNRISIKGAARRQGSLQARLGPKVGASLVSTQKTATDNDADRTAVQDVVSDNETEVMIPDGFGGHTREKRPRSQQRADGNKTAPVLLQRIDMGSDYNASVVPSSHADTLSAESTTKWRVGSFYGPDGAETARLDLDTGTISEVVRHASASDAGQARSNSSSVSMTRSQASSNGPKASLMQSPSNPADLKSAGKNEEEDEYEDRPVEVSTKAAALAQNRRSRTSLASVSMRSKRGLHGLEEAERGGALVSLDSYRMTYDTGLHVLPHEITALDQDSVMGSARLGSAQPTKMTLSQSEMPPSALQSSLTSSATKSNVSEIANTNLGSKIKNCPRRSLSETNINAALLERQGTLLSTTANPLRRSKELNRLLGNSDRKLPSSVAKPISNDANGLKRSNAVGTSVEPPPAVLEQGKARKARVEVDLVLESDLAVEGGTLQGRMQIRVREGSKKEGGVYLAQPKIRIVGFEELLADDTRYIFYHHASVIDGDRSNNGPSEPYYLHGSPRLSSLETAPFSALSCFSGGPDAEGYAEGKVGSHSIPFSLELPVSKGAKGSYHGKNAIVRYIVIGSVKLKSASGSNRSIAHFYRHVDLFPYLNPAVVLSNSLKPIEASSSKGLFLGGTGKVHLVASLHRNTWVAGQRMYINVGIQNDTSKKINGMTLSLIRTVTLYKPRPELDLDIQKARKDLDPDACQTSTTRKKIAEEELEMGQKGSKGVVTAKGWWTGVEPGQRVETSHYMHIPADALSISRGRHVEVVYSIKVSIGSSLSSDVSVELPLRVINFVSLDPPPLKKAVGAHATRSWTAPGNAFSSVKSPSSPSARAMGGDADQIARLKSVDAMRSPGKTEIALHNHDQHLQAARILSPGEVAAEQTRRIQHQKSLDVINHAIRSAAARRGVDVTPTTSSSARTPSPAGLGIGVLESNPSSSSTSSSSPGGNSSTDGNSRADEELEDSDSKTPMAPRGLNMPSTLYPPGCEPYEPHHHQAHQAQYVGAYSQLPVALHLPGGMHHMQQMQMQMYQMAQLAQPDYARTSYPAAMMGGSTLPMLRINNTNAVTLDEVGDDYDDDEHDGADQTLALNDESMAEMNMVIGSARLDDDDYGQFDDSMHVNDVFEHEMAPVIEESSNVKTAGHEGWSLRRRDSSEDRDDHGEQWMGEEEADDVAEVSSIMQAVSIAPASHPADPSDTKAEQVPRIPTRDDSRPISIRPTSLSGAPESVTRPLKIIKGPSAATLPQQVIRTQASSDQLPERSTRIPLSKTAPQQVLSAANLKRHSDNLTYRQQQQHSRHRSTHSVTGLKPLLLQPKATSSGSRSPDTASPREASAEFEEGSEEGKSPKSTADEVLQTAQSASRHSHSASISSLPIKKTNETAPGRSALPSALVKKPSEASLATASTSPVKPASSMPRSSTLQNLSPAKPALRHSDSTSSLVSDASTSTPSGAISRSHSTHNLRGAAVMVPSVRNKIAMLESRSAALRDFTSAVTDASPSASPMKSSASSGRVAQLAASAERAASLTPSSSGQIRLGRKDSVASVAESEDAASVLSSIAPVPEYMKTASSGIGSFNAPVLRSLR